MSDLYSYGAKPEELKSWRRRLRLAQWQAAMMACCNRWRWMQAELGRSRLQDACVEAFIAKAVVMEAAGIRGSAGSYGQERREATGRFVRFMASHRDQMERQRRCIGSGPTTPPNGSSPSSPPKPHRS